MRSLYTFFVIVALFPMIAVRGQNSNNLPAVDSLTLPLILNEVMRTYPSIKKAQQEIESANAKIGLAKSGYYPEVNVSSSYSHVGPTSSISIPNMGTFSLFPANNYSAALNYNQSIYDFGKTASSVSLEKQNKTLAQLSVEQIKQRLSLSLAGNYFVLVFLQDALIIKNEELLTLNEHLRFVEKKAATGSATQYEVLTTKVRISAIENQKTDLLTSLQVQTCQLNSFLGRAVNSALSVKKDLRVSEEIAPLDSLIAFSLDHRDEMIISRQKTALAEARYKMVNAQNNPGFNFFATGGLKNGYVPDLAVARANYAVGVGFKMPIFDAHRTKFSALQVKAEQQGYDQDTELARRNIVNEVVEGRANTLASLKKVKQSELQLQQAKQASALAETSFQAGTITNLDLLDNSTAVAECRLALLKTKIDYTFSLLKLKIALGERIY